MRRVTGGATSSRILQRRVVSRPCLSWENDDNGISDNCGRSPGAAHIEKKHKCVVASWRQRLQSHISKYINRYHKSIECNCNCYDVVSISFQSAKWNKSKITHNISELPSRDDDNRYVMLSNAMCGNEQSVMCVLHDYARTYPSGRSTGMEHSWESAWQI